MVLVGKYGIWENQQSHDCGSQRIWNVWKIMNGIWVEVPWGKWKNLETFGKKSQVLGQGLPNFEHLPLQMAK